jgi:hypothetical protein
MGTSMHRLPLIALSAAAAALAACDQQQPPVEDNAAEEPVLNLPAVPRPEPPIDRATLLAAIAEAASATAAGAQLPETVRSLDGRQFELRIRFGCRGPATELRDRWLGWSFDPDKRRIRVRAKPTISIDDPLVAELSGEEFEAVEGFWIPRPWLLQAVCPAAAAVQSSPGEGQAEIPANSSVAANQRQPAANATASSGNRPEESETWAPSVPRIGIAQFFTSDDPRTRRRDTRPYEASHTLPEGRRSAHRGTIWCCRGAFARSPAAE